MCRRTEVVLIDSDGHKAYHRAGAMTEGARPGFLDALT